MMNEAFATWCEGVGSELCQYLGVTSEVVRGPNGLAFALGTLPIFSLEKMSEGYVLNTTSLGESGPIFHSRVLLQIPSEENLKEAVSSIIMNLNHRKYDLQSLVRK